MTKIQTSVTSVRPEVPMDIAAWLRQATLPELRSAIGIMLGQNPVSGRLWDLLTALRGPDSPSEPINRHDEQAYRKRRERKYSSTEVIRQAAFFGVVGGAARYHAGTSVQVRHREQQDHFDRHVIKAASVLGLAVTEQPYDDTLD